MTDLEKCVKVVIVSIVFIVLLSIAFTLSALDSMEKKAVILIQGDLLLHHGNTIMDLREEAINRGEAEYFVQSVEGVGVKYGFRWLEED